MFKKLLRDVTPLKNTTNNEGWFLKVKCFLMSCLFNGYE